MRDFRRLASNVLAGAAALGLLLGIGFGLSRVAEAQLTSLGPNVFSGSVSTLQSAFYPANPARRLLTICAQTQAILVTFGTTVSPTTTLGLPVAAGACANVPPVPFQFGAPGGGIGGQVNVIAATGTAVVTVLEY
jgi:hypothetical protein